MGSSRNWTLRVRSLFSTYVGGHELDLAKGLAVDPVGNIYVAGSTQSTDFPSVTTSIRRGEGVEAFLCKIAPAASPQGFVGGVPGSPWTRYMLYDSNGNGRPDADDQPFYGIREGTRFTYTCPAIPNWSGKAAFELSNPHPVTGAYQTATARWRHRASDVVPASAGLSATQEAIAPMTFNEKEEMLSLSATVTRYSEQLRAIAGSIKMERTGTDGTNSTAEFALEAQDSNQDGVAEGVKLSGNANLSGTTLSGRRTQALVPMQLSIPLTYFDVNGDGKMDYTSVPWATMRLLLSSLGLTSSAAIFVPLADTNGDGSPDTPAFDSGGDGHGDTDLVFPTFLSGTANPTLEHKLYFAQFGNGTAGPARIDSQIVLFNLDKSHAANAHIEIRDDAGQSWTLSLNGQNVPGQLDRVIPAGGLLALKTDGTGDVKSGSVTTTSDRPLAGVIIFGGSVGVAGVGSSTPTRTGFIAPIEARGNEVNTGIAMMNLEDAEASLQLEALDSSAKVLARAAVGLPGLGHRAVFLTELAWDSPINLAQFTGLVRVSGNRRIAATVVQSRPGEMATMPVTSNLTAYSQNRPAWTTPTPEAVLHQDRHLYFAHFADGAVPGAQLFSQIILANADPLRAATGRIYVRDDSGNPLTVDFNGQNVPGQTDVVVPPNGLAVLKTDGQGSLVSGSVTVDSDQLLSGVIVLGGTVGLAGVGSSPELGNGLLAPMQRNVASGLNTGVALMNLEATALEVVLELMSADGTSLATAKISLGANGHRALFVSEINWDKPVDLTSFQGLLSVTAAGRFSGTVLQTASSSFATMPVAPKLR